MFGLCPGNSAGVSKFFMGYVPTGTIFAEKQDELLLFFFCRGLSLT